MFVNNRDQLSGFGQRLFDLMTEAGFNTPRALAVRLLEQGLVIVNTRAKDPYKSQQSAIGCVEKKINHHLHEQTAKRLQGEFVLAYCNVFNCTPDYLFGFINTRYHSKNIQNACECTGLSEPAVHNLDKCWHSGATYPCNIIFSYIIESDVFQDLTNNWDGAVNQAYTLAQLNVDIQKNNEQYEKLNPGAMRDQVLGPERTQLSNRRYAAEGAYLGYIYNFSAQIYNSIKGKLDKYIYDTEEYIRNNKQNNQQQPV